MKLDPLLLDYATEAQKIKIKAVIEHGTYRKAAKAVGCCYSSISNAVDRVKIKAARQGYSPDHNMDNTVPEGYSVKGVSTLYGPDGEVKAQWVKSQADREKQEELLRLVVDGLADEVRGLSKATKAPRTVNADLLAGYPLPEPHFGMFSWGKETGSDYDCAEASKIILSSMANLVDSAPEAETALISDIGDWFHTDTTENKTAKAGNQLDVDSRWGRVVKIGVDVFVEVVSMALAKHKKVKVSGVGGNHSPHTSYMIALILDAYFRNNVRVEVDLSPNPYKFHRFGKNLIGINHGDMGKPAELAAWLKHLEV
jgi:hypothetical protein